MKNNILIVSFRSSARVHLGPNLISHSGMQIDGVLVGNGFPPWPSSPDILCNSRSRTWVGVSYLVAPAYQQQVKDVFRQLSSEAVRYNDGSNRQGGTPYAGVNENIHYLEVIWATEQADELRLAQLGDDIWFYPMTDDYESRFIAFGVTHVDEILVVLQT
jgi:hypothetical protein